MLMSLVLRGYDAPEREQITGCGAMSSNITAVVLSGSHCSFLAQLFLWL